MISGQMNTGAGSANKWICVKKKTRDKPKGQNGGQAKRCELDKTGNHKTKWMSNPLHLSAILEPLHGEIIPRVDHM